MQVLPARPGYVQGSKGQPPHQEASGAARVEEAMYVICPRYNGAKTNYSVGHYLARDWVELVYCSNLDDAMEWAARLNATLKGYSE